MTHILRKEDDRYFIYFSYHLFPTEESSFGNHKAFKREWFESCAKKGNKVEVAKDEIQKLTKWLYDYYNIHHDKQIEDGCVIPLCYEVREVKTHQCNAWNMEVCSCKYSCFAYFKEPELEHHQVIKEAQRLASKEMMPYKRIEKLGGPERKQEREELEICKQALFKADCKIIDLENKLASVGNIRAKGWIAVTERLPEKGSIIDLWLGDVRFPYRAADFKYDNWFYDGTTHWMPKPEPPHDAK